MRGASAILIALMAGSPQSGPASGPTAFAEALQRKYDGVRDFETDFVHSYRGGALRRQLTERGRVVVKKPGKMRWEYESPEKKLFVSDGVKLYSYFPADKQVIVADVPAGSDATTPGLFLAGKGDLTRDFTATFVEVPDDMPSGSTALKLVPRNPQPEYEWLILVADARSLALRGLVWADAQGGTSRFVFGNLKENLGPPDKQFIFIVPRGVEVVTDVPTR